MKMWKKLMRLIGLRQGSTVSINGVTYTGNTVEIINGKLYVDGKTKEQPLIGPISVVVHGGVDKVESMSGDVTVNGNIAGSVSTMSGDVICQGIGGSVDTMSGDIITRK